jgi:hypothetical protein
MMGSLKIFSIQGVRFPASSAEVGLAELHSGGPAVMPEEPVSGTEQMRMLPDPGAYPSHGTFSSSDLAGLKDVDSFRQLPGLPGAAAEFAQDAPGLELGVCAFARAA